MFRVLLCTVVYLSALGVLNGQERVQRIGNPMRASKAGIDEPEGATFIINDVVLADGVVYAYQAFFRSMSAVRFQIWRPLEDNDIISQRTFQLVTELRVVPTDVNLEEDVYIASRLGKQCTRVQKGDALGIHFEETPGSIAYTFDPFNPQAYARSLNSSIPNYADEPIMFDLLQFPYDFSVAAYVDTDLSLYPGNDSDVECPKTLSIPAMPRVSLETTTFLPVMGEKGDTGSTGPTGEMGETGPAGEMGATGPEGPIGFTGATGPQGIDGVDGLDGYNGTDGLIGQTGATGARGPQGPRGPPGETITLVYPAEFIPRANSEENSLLESYLSTIGIYIWLVVLTSIIVILIIIACCIYCKKRRYKRDAKRTFVVTPMSEKSSHQHHIDIPDIEQTSTSTDEDGGIWAAPVTSSESNNQETQEENRSIAASNEGLVP